MMPWRYVKRKAGEVFRTKTQYDKVRGYLRGKRLSIAQSLWAQWEEGDGPPQTVEALSKQLGRAIEEELSKIKP